MFKTIQLFNYSIEGGFPCDASSYLTYHEFEPCGATQEQSEGWVPPRGNDWDDTVEIINGQIILKLMIETKKVPSEVLERKLEERKVAIDELTGRKPGRKESRDLKEEIKLELLPVAFSSRSAVMVWFNPATGIVVMNATGSKADIALTTLIRSIPGLSMSTINTVTSPSSAMSSWLLDVDLPSSFTADRSCELKACDESKAKVKYDNHSLDIEEVHEHIKAGKIPTKLAMTFDDRVSFVLTDTLVLKKVGVLDSAIESQETQDGDAFDADIVLITGELQPLIAELIDALGGQVKA